MTKNTHKRIKGLEISFYKYENETFIKIFDFEELNLKFKNEVELEKDFRGMEKFFAE